MDGRATAQVLLSLPLTCLTAIHVGQEGLAYLPRCPIFRASYGTPMNPSFLFLNSAVWGFYFPASLRG